MFELSGTNELHTTYIPSGHDVKKRSERRRTLFNSMFARLGTNYEIINQCFFAILEAMTAD